MVPTYNLVDEPWIPVSDQAGRIREVGLREALVHAHEISALHHPSPLVAVSLHRLLLAILHRNFGPAGPNEWAALWRRGRWDTATLEDYLRRWKERFDLFHPQRPFYQVPFMPDAVLHPPEYLMQEAASGNNATLFDHHYEQRPDMLRPADAACYLLAKQNYAIGFGKSSPFYFSDAPLVRGLTVLVHGETLFETLMLNLWKYKAPEEDVPAWEDDNPPLPDKEGTLPRGYLDYLTWQSRRIHLVPAEGALAVSACQIQQNLRLRDEYEDEPFKAYRRDDKRGMVPVSLTPGRAAWRNADALFQLPVASGTAGQQSTLQQPKIFGWLNIVRQWAQKVTPPLRPVYRFGIYGMATQKGKAASVVLWAQEELPLPLDLLEDTRLVDYMGKALDLAEKVALVERRAVQTLAALLLAPQVDGPKSRQPHPKDVSEFARHLDPLIDYWAALGGAFRKLMLCLPEDAASALNEWRDSVENSARSSFTRLVASIGGSAREMKAIVQAERTFRAGLSGQISTWKEGGVDDEQAP